MFSQIGFSPLQQYTRQRRNSRNEDDINERRIFAAARMRRIHNQSGGVELERGEGGLILARVVRATDCAPSVTD